MAMEETLGENFYLKIVGVAAVVFVHFMYNLFGNFFTSSWPEWQESF